MARKKSFWDDAVNKVYLQQPAIIKTDATVVDAVKEMQRYRIGCVLIVDKEEKLVGIMTHGDIMHDYVGTTLPNDVTVDQLMTPDPFAITGNRTVREVAEIFHTKPFRHLPVLKKGEIMGILSVRGLMSYIGENLPTDVLNLPPDSSLIASQQAGE